jgi:hypothetical protein
MSNGPILRVSITSAVPLTATSKRGSLSVVKVSWHTKLKAASCFTWCASSPTARQSPWCWTWSYLSMLTGYSPVWCLWVTYLWVGCIQIRTCKLLTVLCVCLQLMLYVLPSNGTCKRTRNCFGQSNIPPSLFSKSCDVTISEDFEVTHTK